MPALPTSKVAFTVPAGAIKPVRYVAAPVKATTQAALAEKFVAFLLTPEAQKVLLANGFKPAPTKAVPTRAERHQCPHSPTSAFPLRLSLQVALLATVAVAVVGLPLAYLLATREFRGKAVLDVAVTLPLVLPPIVTGYYLLLVIGRNGLLGRALSAAGLPAPRLTFTWQAAYWPRSWSPCRSPSRPRARRSRRSTRRSWLPPTLSGGPNSPPPGS